MHIRTVKVENFRCLEALSVELDPFTALIGANGSGKSAVLHALNWFFNGVRGDEFDFRVGDDGLSLESFSVTVTLHDLDAASQSKWSRYMRGGQLVLRRTADSSGGDRLSGRSMQGPGFADIRNSTEAAGRRHLYGAVRGALGLPGAVSKAAIDAALDAWEAEPTNVARLVEVADADLSQAFGFNGKNLLQDLVQFVLVPASTRLEENVDPAGRGGAIDRLLGAVIKLAADEEVASWTSVNQSAIATLGSKISAAVDSASTSQVEETNKYLSEMIEGAVVSIDVQFQPPKIQPQMVVSATLTFEGPPLPIAKQGHGVQRSVMMSTLQAAAGAAGRTAGSLVLAIEEPELYQHPARSIALSKALRRLADGGVWQVLVATHSPSFLGTAAAASLRRFSRSGGAVSVVEGSVANFVTRSGESEATVRRHLENLLPGEFADAYFVDRVLLVEGLSDLIVLSRVLQLQGVDVESRNWAVVNCGGKWNLPIAAAVLLSLHVDVRVVFDGDCRGDSEDTKHRTETNRLLAEFRRLGLLRVGESYAFGDPSRSFAAVSVMRRDIEDEEIGWHSFMGSMSARTGSATVASKNAYFVREGAAAAILADCPLSLLAIAEMLVKPLS